MPYLLTPCVRYFNIYVWDKPYQQHLCILAIMRGANKNLSRRSDRTHFSCEQSLCHVYLPIRGLLLGQKSTRHDLIPCPFIKTEGHMYDIIEFIYVPKSFSTHWTLLHQDIPVMHNHESGKLDNFEKEIVTINCRWHARDGNWWGLTCLHSLQ